MAKKVWGCENPKCTNKGYTEVMNINPDSGILDKYCLKKKRGVGLVVDPTLLMNLKKKVMQPRCGVCFNAFLKREKLDAFYHLMDGGEFENRIRVVAEESDGEEKSNVSRVGGENESSSKGTRGEGDRVSSADISNGGETQEANRGEGPSRAENVIVPDDSQGTQEAKCG